MDSITQAVVAAVAGLAQPAVKDAYEALKTALAHKFGAHADLGKAVAALEAQPASPARCAMVAEEMAASGAAKDQEIIELAARLAALAEKTAGAITVHQEVRGKGNFVAGGNMTVNVSKPGAGSD